MPIESDDKSGSSEESLTEIESFFGKKEEILKKKSYNKCALVIGMVVHRGLCNQHLKDLESTNARDLIRCLAIEKFHNCYVKNSIALNNGGINGVIEGHFNIDVRTNKSMDDFSKSHVNIYNYIYVDYYRVNNSYLSEHMLTENFFERSLPLLWETLMAGGKIFYPFLPGVVRNMIGSLHPISQLFDISYVTDKNIHRKSNYLWTASNRLLKHKTLKSVMSYEETKKANFGGVTIKKILNTQSEKSTPDEVKLYCQTIENIESVLFVELTKYNNYSTNKKSSGSIRQVRGTDIMFLLFNAKLHMIKIKARLTPREIDVMYTGRKKLFGVNANLNKGLHENEGYLLIVKQQEEIKIAFCFRKKDGCSVFVVIRNANDYEQIQGRVINMDFIVNKCVVICNSHVNDHQKISNGYFVNEVYGSNISEENMCPDKHLYISHVSPDKFCLATPMTISDVVKHNIQYQVVYVPHDAIGKHLPTSTNALFSIPIKHVVKSNEW